jgi:hypothetical protein
VRSAFSAFALASFWQLAARFSKTQNPLCFLCYLLFKIPSFVRSAFAAFTPHLVLAVGRPLFKNSKSSLFPSLPSVQISSVLQPEKFGFS